MIGRAKRKLTTIRHVIAAGKPRLASRLFVNAVANYLGHTPLFKHLEIALTYDCNLSCDHCSCQTLRSPGKQAMTLSDYRELGRQAKELRVPLVSFTGGEPLLRPDLAAIIGCFYPRETMIGITTNGLLADDARLRPLKSAGLDIMVVSLDSSVPEKHDAFRHKNGSFDASLRAIQRAKELGIRPIIIYTVHHQNVASDLEEMAVFALSIQAPLHISLAAPVGKWGNDASCSDYLLTDDDIALIARLRKKYPHIRRDLDNTYGKYRCPAGTGRIALTPDGEAMVCTKIHISFGNVKRDSLLVIRDRMMQFKEFRSSPPHCLVAEDKDFIARYVTTNFGRESSLVPFDHYLKDAVEAALD